MALADPGSGISLEELQLAARNHGMPLEALRHDLTPVGLHYLLIHYDIPAIEPDGWRLSIAGAVETPVSLALDDLRSTPAATVTVTLECAGNGRARLEPRPISQPWLQEAVGTAAWTGVPVRTVMERAKLSDDAVELVFTGIDRGVEGDVEQAYARSLRVGEAMREDVILAYDMNGAPLSPQHGFPLRLVVPGWYGMTHVKWLGSITAVTEPFDGYQNSVAYRVRSDPEEAGIPVERIRPRSLMIPPGIPEFLSRSRIVQSGAVELSGRAWSGMAPIERVEVTTDGGATWDEANLEPALDRFAWCRWSYRWMAEPGTHRLGSRAIDASGAGQPSDVVWNAGGYEVNAVQFVTVTVR